MRQTYKLSLSWNMHGWQTHIPSKTPLSAQSKMYLFLNPRPRSRHVHSPAELKMSLCWVLHDHISFIFAQPENPPRSQKRKWGIDRHRDSCSANWPHTVYYDLKVSVGLICHLRHNLVSKHPAALSLDKSCTIARGQLHHTCTATIC